MARNFRNIFDWLVHRPAYLLMTAQGDGLQSQPPRKFQRAWIGLMALSLGWGLLSCGIWVLCQRAFEPNAHGVPAAATGVVFCLWLYRRSLISTAQVLAPRDASARALAISLLALGVVGIYSAFMGGEGIREFDLPDAIKWALPYERHYRLLLLAPLWGAWAMIIAPKFCRLSPAAEPAVAAFAGGCGPFRAVLCMVLPLAGTLFYFQYLHWSWQVIIPVVTIITAPAAAWICSRRQGLRHSTLLAANLLTQLVFLLTYMAGLNLGGKTNY
jgi:hypothetical protein